MRMMINISDARIPCPAGVQFLFDNDWVLSIIIGRGAYCDTRYMNGNDFTRTCEIAVWKHSAANHEMIQLNRDEKVSGWFPVCKLSQLMNEMSAPDVTEQQIIDSARELAKEPF